MASEANRKQQIAELQGRVKEIQMRLGASGNLTSQDLMRPILVHVNDVIVTFGPRAGLAPISRIRALWEDNDPELNTPDIKLRIAEVRGACGEADWERALDLIWA